MGLNRTELEEHCQKILQSGRIANKIVILCEGSIQSLKSRRSPSAYSRLETMPDANFYKACVPREWKNNLPVFFNCGDRVDVLNTYRLLKERYDELVSKLNPNLLFAFVDLDLQINEIEDYLFSNTEKIFENLYENFELKNNILPNHKIFTAGLIYKEAYFLLPELQDVFFADLEFTSFPLPTYKNQTLSLEELYQDILENLEQDQNLKTNFQIAKDRLNFCKDLDLTDVASLKNSLEKSSDSELLAYKLLSISQVKDYWKSIEPNEEFTGALETWRDQLILMIGHFYSTSTNPKHHIAGILRAIYNYYYG